MRWLGVLLIPVFILGSCATAPPQGSPVYNPPPAETSERSIGTITRDALLYSRIRSKLASDDLVQGGGLSFKVRNGVVFVTGSVEDPYQVRMIENLIRTVDGVVRVENRMSASASGFIVE